jgi:hypothetical protein
MYIYIASKRAFHKPTKTLFLLLQLLHMWVPIQTHAVAHGVLHAELTYCSLSGSTCPCMAFMLQGL